VRSYTEAFGADADLEKSLVRIARDAKPELWPSFEELMAEARRRYEKPVSAGELQRWLEEVFRG